MQTLSKDQVALRLQAPNGAAALMEQAEAALDGALALFLEDQDPAACGFLCRCAKSNRLRQQIQAALSSVRKPWARPFSPRPPSCAKTPPGSWGSSAPPPTRPV